MIITNIYTTMIHDGQLQEALAARFSVSGQDFQLLEGDGRFVQLGLPVYSERYGRMIDFNTDGEEWASNLPMAYRNGSISICSEEVVEGLGRERARETEAVEMRDYA